MVESFWSFRLQSKKYNIYDGKNTLESIVLSEGWDWAMSELNSYHVASLYRGISPTRHNLITFLMCVLQLVIHSVSMLSRTDSTFTYFLRDSVSVMADDSIAVLWTANLLYSVSKTKNKNKTKHLPSPQKTKQNITKQNNNNKSICLTMTSA